MSRHDDTQGLTAVLEQEAVRLRELAESMRRNRMHYVALRPSAMTGAVAAMEAIAAECAALAAQRTELLERLGGRLDDALAGLPPAAEKQLRDAAARARAAAGEVRIENGVGRRLLEFSRQAQESLLLSLYGAAPVAGYDRHARAVRGTARGGALIQGIL
jgi:hypothetical protein